MGRQPFRTSLVAAAIAFVAIPSTASAQSAISGVVRDSSGGILPGVSVQAASPALIERVREAVTDEQGRYTIVDLRPGLYKVTFALAGFTTLVRDGIDLPSNFTATCGQRHGIQRDVVAPTLASATVEWPAAR